MTSLERVLTTLGHKEPDRVPMFLLATMHGAKELGLTIREYFSKAENVVEGQLRLRAKYGHDCLYSFFYAPLEVEAWGGEVIFSDNGPANSGEPFVRNTAQIMCLEPPNVKETHCLGKVLKCIEMLKARVGNEAPIIGVIMSPFSLPVMQMGFDRYIELMYEQPEVFNHLMRVNEEFAVRWGNAQLEAGATALAYFDPVSSPTIIPRDLCVKSGFQVAKRMLSRIKGPVAMHMASGRCLPIAGDLAQMGAAVVGTSCLEDLADVKAAFRGKMTVLGNLNGVEMCRWTVQEATKAVRDAIARAGEGGGYILSDNHGEIPFQVPDETLMAIADAVRRYGVYPLNLK